MNADGTELQTQRNHENLIQRIVRLLRKDGPAPESNDDPNEPTWTQLDVPQVPSTLQQTLQHANWVNRREAVWQLRNYPLQATLSHLATALQDEDTNVRLAAVETAAVYNESPARNLLVSALHDRDAVVIDAAASVLRRSGQDTVPQLVELLEHPNINTRGVAAEVLCELAPEEAVPNLIAALSDESTPWLQQNRICDIAAMALERIATPEAWCAVDWWREMHNIQSEENKTRNEHGELFVADNANEEPTETAEATAVEPHGAEGNADVSNTYDAPRPLTEQVDAWLAELENGKWGTKEDAAKQLQAFAKARANQLDNDAIATQMMRLLSSPDWVVRVTIVECLAWLNTPFVVDDLLPLLTDEHWIVRAGAARALAEYAAPEALNALCVAMGDPYVSVREAAAEAVGRSKDARVIPSLDWVLRDDDPHVRLLVVNALVQIDTDEIVSLLLKASSDSDVNVRWTAVNALKGLANEFCVPILRECLHDESHPAWEERRVCDLAADALKRIGTPEAIVALQNWNPA